MVVIGCDFSRETSWEMGADRRCSACRMEKGGRDSLGGKEKGRDTASG